MLTGPPDPLAARLAALAARGGPWRPWRPWRPAWRPWRPWRPAWQPLAALGLKSRTYRPGRDGRVSRDVRDILVDLAGPAGWDVGLGRVGPSELNISGRRGRG
eukprot:gene12065-biopygen1754